ncbi:MAG: hypothetical protein J6W52_07985 [Bacteroidaceae bacterium]|nr:hypothetical protein [Bacteroidaceae bacterium]
MDWTNVILGVLTLLGGCGWVVNRRKYKAEVQQNYMDLAKEYVEEFRRNIGEPLQEEVGQLRQEVKELKDAVEGINDCPYRADCPVRERMRGKSHRSEDGGKRTEG